MSPITTILLNCPVFDPVSSPCCLVSTSAELHLKGTKSAEDTVMCITMVAVGPEFHVPC